MVAYYQHDIASWMDGTEGLTDGQYRAYHVVCELIYLNNGPIVLHESGIAGRCNQHTLAFRCNLKKLIELGKIVECDKGKISNRRVEAELAKIMRRKRGTSAAPPADPRPTPAEPPANLGGVSNRSKGGNARKPLKSNNATAVVRRIDKTRIDKTIKEESDSSNPWRELPFADAMAVVELPDDGLEVPAPKSKSKNNGTALPKDWKPTASDIAYAINKLGISLADVDDHAEDMRLWAYANANRGIAKKDDWEMTFKGWMRRETKKQKGRSSNEANRNGSPQRGFGTFAARVGYAKVHQSGNGPARR